jgi:hypothetical protein
MIRSILVFIKSDPQKSHKPAEAVRIALGLLSGDHEVKVVLMNLAPLLLGEEAEDLVDGELLMKYLPTLIELGQTFYVEQTAWESLAIGRTEAETASVSVAEIGKMVQDADILISF